MALHKDSRLYNLPFDQFSRQEIVRDIVDTCIRPLATNDKPGRALRIIDLGGHRGYTRDFFPDDEVTILDVIDESYDNYIKGDATNIDAADDAYDVVVSFDTFEHIPQDLREKFLHEATRIAKYATIVAAPFESARIKLTHEVEAETNSLYKKIFDEEHPWLKEHIEYGLPEVSMVEAWLAGSSVQGLFLPSNNLRLWQMGQGLMFNSAALGHDVKDVVDVSAYYNRSLDDLDSSPGPSYRQIVLLSKNEAAFAALESYVAKRTLAHSPKKETAYVGKINKAYGAVIQDLLADRDYLAAREKHLQEMYDQAEDQKKVLNQNIAELQAHIRVLEKQKQPYSRAVASKLKRGVKRVIS